MPPLPIIQFSDNGDSGFITCSAVDEVQIHLAIQRAHEHHVRAGRIISAQIKVGLSWIVKKDTKRMLGGLHLQK